MRRDLLVLLLLVAGCAVLGWAMRPHEAERPAAPTLQLAPAKVVAPP